MATHGKGLSGTGEPQQVVKVTGPGLRGDVWLASGQKEDTTPQPQRTLMFLTLPLA